ncbi:DUF4400 domain-containing protein [Pseudoduganella sp. UC29_106]|uniref:DUF4400 domain-containing protein n=1 Tax=Pseudoduganella sp. UC29_106 TaxID=3374553 RepID=UPI003756CB8D
MIRIVAITSLAFLLVLVLYLPSARPASAFIAQVRIEHAALSSFWGSEHAIAVLENMLEFQHASTPHPPLMPAQSADAKASNKVHNEVAAVGHRLLNNEYFRSLNALLVLATYRVAVLLFFLAGVAPFLTAAFVDGLVRRAVKGKDFSGHHPEVFSGCSCGVIVIACAIVIACVIPEQLPAILFPMLLVACGALASIGIANYPRRL